MKNSEESDHEYWRNWWDQYASRTNSDYVLNRGTTCHLPEIERRSLKQFVQAVDPNPNDVVFDAGCGSGRNISLLSPRVKEIVGMDYSEQMVRRAAERVAEEKLGNVKLLQGDITALPFATDSFDKVICASVLQYLPDDDCARAMHELVRVCRPGGRLILHVKNGTSLYGLSLRVLRPVARLVGKRMKPEYYRSRRWHTDVLQREEATLIEYDGFGILTFVPLPQIVVSWLLRIEMALRVPKPVKHLGVNYKMTLAVRKGSAARKDLSVP